MTPMTVGLLSSHCCWLKRPMGQTSVRVRRSWYEVCQPLNTNGTANSEVRNKTLILQVGLHLLLLAAQYSLCWRHWLVRLLGGFSSSPYSALCSDVFFLYRDGMLHMTVKATLMASIICTPVSLVRFLISRLLVAGLEQWNPMETFSEGTILQHI